MKQKFLIVGIVILVLLVLSTLYSYTKPKITPETTPTPTTIDFSNVLITMERSACYGVCPAYSLTIYGDGTVIYEGDSFVKITEKRVYKISQDNIQNLIDEFYRINYFSLKDKYDAGVTDVPHTLTTIKINGNYKSVYNRWGGPRELNNLENKIDEITNSKQWVKGLP